MRLIDNLILLYNDKKKIINLLLVVLIAAIPLINLSSYIMRIIVLIGIYVILASSLNLLTGFTGQVSLGHAAFYGIGAYTSALLAVHFNLPFLVTMLAGGTLSAFFGFLLGLPTLRLNGTYLSIVTLGFCEITRIVELNWMKLTNGPMGVTSIPFPKIFGVSIDTDTKYFYLMLVLVMITLIVINNIIASRTGRALISIREDELAAEAMGINVLIYKVIAFTVSAFFAGIAGSFYAHYVTFIDPGSFSFNESIQILSIVILGGMGSVPGTILGSALLVSIPEVLRGLQLYRMLIYGLVLVVMMLVRPQGILGDIRLVDIVNRIKEKNKPKEKSYEEEVVI